MVFDLIFRISSDAERCGPQPRYPTLTLYSGVAMVSIFISHCLLFRDFEDRGNVFKALVINESYKYLSVNLS